ncbi:MAG TPA: arginine--tRNA ligase [Gammaproteobacteria bacterium]|nr:arginine--tRNA ligase [Gammaproteobacteria bacterium]
MKHHLESLLQAALNSLVTDGLAPAEAVAAIPVKVERARDRRHGDFASNLALALAGPARQAPRQLAEALVARLPGSDTVAKVAVAGPGFINFFMSPAAWQAVVSDILRAGPAFGRSTVGNDKPVQVEFVSANPTGPLHVGHGRGAAYGAAVANLLDAAGFRVHREYYVNDAGRQMDILAASLWLRYLELAGETLRFPSNGYQGGYVREMAADLRRIHGERLRRSASLVMADLPADAPEGDKEEHIDALIERCKTLLGRDDYRAVFDVALNTVLADIRADLAEFGVTYDDWYSERSLTASGAVRQTIERLKQSGHCYEKDGALWFRSTDYGDEKDRVLVRDNGQTTYFASDIAYHLDKFQRGFHKVVDVWGADHHGYVPRVKAALQAMGEDPARLDVLLVQFAILYRGGEKLSMSTRSGEFVTLRELRGEVGCDAARFFYVMRRAEQHLDFDLDLAKSQSSDNPVYYVQYAHARVCSVLKQLKEKGLVRDEARGGRNLHLLHEEHERALLYRLSHYPEIVEAAALGHEPHLLAHYLRELANELHTYYNAHQFLVDDDALRDARLNLISAVRQVIANGLDMLGVSAPEAM